MGQSFQQQLAAMQQMAAAFNALGPVPDVENPPPTDDLDPDAPPDLQGEVLGWRDWMVSAYGDLLSRNSHAVWRPGANRAICSFGDREIDHEAPQSRCKCGFYGMHSTRDVNYSDDHHVRGLFAAWGKIVVHPTGFRSEWAEVICLVHPEPTKRVKRAGGYYDVPIFASEGEALTYASSKGYGLVPEEMRPERDPPPTEEGARFFWASAGAPARSHHHVSAAMILPPAPNPPSRRPGSIRPLRRTKRDRLGSVVAGATLYLGCALIGAVAHHGFGLPFLVYLGSLAIGVAAMVRYGERLYRWWAKR